MKPLLHKILLTSLLVTLVNTSVFAETTATKCSSKSILANTELSVPPPYPNSTSLDFYFLPHTWISSLYTYVSNYFEGDDCK